jgi:hypothetical protein
VLETVELPGRTIDGARRCARRAGTLTPDPSSDACRNVMLYQSCPGLDLEVRYPAVLSLRFALVSICSFWKIGGVIGLRHAPDLPGTCRRLALSSSRTSFGLGVGWAVAAKPMWRAHDAPSSTRLLLAFLVHSIFLLVYLC